MHYPLQGNRRCACRWVVPRHVPIMVAGRRASNDYWIEEVCCPCGGVGRLPSKYGVRNMAAL